MSFVFCFTCLIFVDLLLFLLVVAVVVTALLRSSSRCSVSSPPRLPSLLLFDRRRRTSFEFTSLLSCAVKIFRINRDLNENCCFSSSKPTTPAGQTNDRAIQYGRMTRTGSATSRSATPISNPQAPPAGRQTRNNKNAKAKQYRRTLFWISAKRRSRRRRNFIFEVVDDGDASMSFSEIGKKYAHNEPTKKAAARRQSVMRKRRPPTYSALSWFRTAF